MYIYDIWWKLIKKKIQILMTQLTPKYICDVRLKLIKENVFYCSTYNLFAFCQNLMKLGEIEVHIEFSPSIKGEVVAVHISRHQCVLSNIWWEIFMNITYLTDGLSFKDRQIWPINYIFISVFSQSSYGWIYFNLDAPVE